MAPRLLHRALLACSLALAVACGGGGKSSGPRLVSIAVTPAAPSLAKGTTLQLVATGTRSDGTVQDVTAQATWSSSGAAVGVADQADQKGLARGMAVGAATVKATVNGVAGQVTVNVTAAELVEVQVTPANPSLPKGVTRQLLATGVFTDQTTQDLTGEVAWSSSDATKASVSDAAGSKGLASAVAPGAAQIRAVHGATGKAGEVTVTVTAATVASVQVSAPPASLPAGFSTQLTATATYTDGVTQDVTSSATWTSSDAARATVAAGRVTGASAGAATITATAPGTTVSGSASVTISAATLASIAVTPASIPAGLSQQLAATGSFSDASTLDLTNDVAWSSSAPSIAAVSNAAGSKGRATGLVAGGPVTVTALLSGVSGTAQVTVTDAIVTALAVTPAAPTVVASLGAQLSAIATLSDGGTRDVTDQVTWSSSAAGVAAVSNAAGSKGLAAAIVAGTTTVRAVHAPTGAAGQATLTVVAPTVQSVAVACAAAVPAGLRVSCTAATTSTDGLVRDVTGTATWSSSDGATASVAGGVVTGVAAGGPVTITASAGGKAGSAQVSVSGATVASVTVQPASGATEVLAGLPEPFRVIGTMNDGTSLDVTSFAQFATSDPTATFSGAVLTATTPLASLDVAALVGTVVGQTSIPVVAPGGGTRTLGIEPQGGALLAGGTQALRASLNVPDPAFPAFSRTYDVTSDATFASSNPAVAVAEPAPGGGWRVRGVAPGTASVTATFGALTANATWKVNVAAQLSFFALTPNVVAGGNQIQAQLALGAPVAVTDPLEVEITSSPAGAVTVPAFDACTLALGHADAICALDVAPVAAETPVTVTVTYRGVARSATLTVTPPRLTGIAVEATVDVGAQALVTAQLDGVAAAPITVTLASSAPGVASVPATVVVPAGQRHADAPVTGVALGTATITGTLGADSSSADVLVNPPFDAPGAAIAIDAPAGVFVGFPDATTTVTITADLVNDTVVTLESLDPSVLTVSPATIVVPANPAGGTSIAGPFTLTADPGVTGAPTVRLRATAGGRVVFVDVLVSP